VIAGDADTLIKAPRELPDRLPFGRLTMVSGDHLTAMYDPAFSLALVEFLEEAHA
jgi:hypothetical protein